MKALFESVACQLDETGFALVENSLAPAILEELRKEAIADYEEGAFKRAAIGKGLEKKSIVEIRSDRVKWLERKQASPAQEAYWLFMDALRLHLAEFFRIHLERTEAHFAVYPKGAFYAKHLDQFQESRNRVFSVILYLNPEWKEGDGGALRLHRNSEQSEDFPPIHGRLIVFRSDLILHEVLPTNTLRVSLSGWMRRDALI